MPRNRDPVKPSESASEEESDSEAEQTTDSESEQTPMPTQKNSAKQTPPPHPQPQPPPSSSSEEEEETESESDESESNVKPVASKPVDEPPKSSNGAKDSRSKANASVPATPTKSVAAKRSAAEDVSAPKDVKGTPAKSVAAKRSAVEDVSVAKDLKKKKTNDLETSEKKSNSFQRVFTEDDEIVILQGMSDYKSEMKSDPVADFDGFHEYIKKKLHADFSRTQLQDKIKRLKRKFENNNARLLKKFENNNGKEKEGKVRLFPNSHEQKLYDLSKAVWENGSLKAGSVARTPNKKVTQAETESASEEVKNVKIGAFVGEAKKLNSIGGVSTEEMMLKIGREVYEAGNGIEGEEEWHSLRAEELELYLKQLKVRAAQAKLVLGLIKPQP